MRQCNRNRTGIILFFLYLLLVSGFTHRAKATERTGPPSEPVSAIPAYIESGELFIHESTDESSKQPIAASEPEMWRQDGRLIEKLRWISPHGEMPGTYEEYVSRHPLKRAFFVDVYQSPVRPNRFTLRTVTDRLDALDRSQLSECSKPLDRFKLTDPSRLPDHCQSPKHHRLPDQFDMSDRYDVMAPAIDPVRKTDIVETPYSLLSILIDAELYPGISEAIERYVNDLEHQEYVVRAATVSGGTAEEIKSWIQGEYDRGSSGIVMVGDVTAAWAEVSGDVFPSDLFYMDLDGYWDDYDGDGDYEIHYPGSGDQGPEVYVARINAHTLDYDTEENMVNDDFDRDRDYRTGLLTQPWRGLEYVDEDWYTMDVFLDLVYGDDVVRYDYGYFTTAADYLDQMDLGQHFVQVCAHSFSTGHHFSMRPTESASYAHLYVHSPTTRIVNLLLGSDDGIKVWLNGDNVCTHDVYQGWEPDEFVHRVTLLEGWNGLLCKISQEGSEYQLSARFTDMFGKTMNDLEYRLGDPYLHEREGEFVRSWLLNGFHQDTSDRFWSYLGTNYLDVPEEEIDPQKGDEHGGKIWIESKSGYPFIDLDEYSNGADFGVCYAYARVHADSAKECRLWLGYDDGVKVWLNGTIVHMDNRYGDYEPDMSKTPVNLDAGENRLLVKVSEWMGNFGFSARFCSEDGSYVEGLSFDPEPKTVDYIGTWLMNGPYANPDPETRLSQDYLGGEEEATPDEGDPAPFGTWEKGYGKGTPFDLADYFDTDGGWVMSEDVQERDPPVLFYNLFACGPGRFTDQDYLAGAYIFNTTYGLITVASSKSGSMLNFQDFTAPLGEGKPIGEAFRLWFDAQAPYEQWEKEWYYGMVLNGDPALRLVEN